MLAGPEPLSLNRVVALAGRAVGRAPLLIHLPLTPIAWLAGTYERIARTPRLKAEQVRRLEEDKSFSILAAERDLGFRSRSFRTGSRRKLP